ncbi:hypothetical protein [Dactylosporangium salmoneum]
MDRQRDQPGEPQGLLLDLFQRMRVLARQQAEEIRRAAPAGDES